MPEQTQSSALVGTIKASLEALQPSRLAEAIVELAVTEPVRWRQLLHLEGIWPEPTPKAEAAKTKLLGQTLACILEAMQVLLERDVDHLDTVLQVFATLQGYFLLQGYYQDIKRKLEKLAFIKSRPEVQIHRLVAFIESTSRHIEARLSKASESSKVFDPTAAHVSVVPSKVDDSKTSLAEYFEIVCENSELGLRFILHSDALSSQPAFDPSNGPYNDPDFEKFTVLAAIWRMVAETGANVRFRDWRWITTRSGTIGCVPADGDAFLRDNAGGVRYQLFITDRVLRRLAGETAFKDFANVLNSVAASIRVPLAGEAWDGQLDLPSFKAFCSLCTLRVHVEEYVEYRHYLPLLDGVRAHSISWREWISGKAVLVSLADVIKQAVTNQVEEDDLACMRQVVVVAEDELIAIIEECSPLNREQARQVVEVLRFDPKRKHLEIWDQPLIPCASGFVFLVPALVCTGNPARALENFVSEWGGAAFDARGKPFEVYLVAELHSRSSARAVRGIQVPRAGDKDLEFDVLAFWDGYLLVLEAKCEKAVFSPADYYRAKCQIEKSIDQLLLRRQAIRSIWPSLRERASALGLPESYIGDDRVLCISVTNIMNFTGYCRDGVVVTDDSCFFRFFEDRMVRRFVLGKNEGEDVAPIREGNAAHPSELLKYLRDPIQMRLLMKNMTLKTHVVPAIGTHSPGFFSIHVESKEA